MPVNAEPRPRGKVTAAVALAAGVASLGLFAVESVYWASPPDLTWTLALGLAPVAFVSGLVATGRALIGPHKGPWAAVGGLVGALLGGLVLTYVALAIYLLSGGYD
jgi:hypothetical protein